MVEFEKLQKEDRLNFPMWATVKVWRKPSKAKTESDGSAAQPANPFDCFIVDAQEQDMSQAPTSVSMKMLSLLDNRLSNSDGVLPATLGMIQKSDHYALAVQYVTQELPPQLKSLITNSSVGSVMVRPCGEAVCLIESTERSKVTTMEDGYQLVTENVRDLLYGETSKAQRCTITAFCTLDTVTDYKLDPPKGAKSRAALVSITGVLEAPIGSAEQPVLNLLTDSVQQLDASQAEALKSVMGQMITFATLAAQMSSRKRPLENWTEEEHPATTSPCRALGRSPTGPKLAEYSP